MYFYIYDEILSQQKYANAIADIETRLTDLELQGRIGRLGPLKSAKEMVKQAIRGGVNTVVAVGTDRTITETVNAIAGTDLTMGIIPVGGESRIARLLGIPEGEEATAILAARKVEIVDLGKISNLYFLTSTEITINAPITLECDDKYTLRAPAEGSTVLTVANLDTGTHCQDGYLEAFIQSSKRQWFKKNIQYSTVSFKKGKIITNNTAHALVENTYQVKLPTTISIIPKILKIIVGKDRAF